MMMAILSMEMDVISTVNRKVDSLAIVQVSVQKYVEMEKPL